MATYFNPRAELHDSSGNPYAGARAYFYITTTSTLKTVYTNEGLTIAHASPYVTADAAGYWPAIFLNTDVAYKVVVKDSSGNTIYTDDPVRPVPLYTDFSTAVTHGYRAANSPVRYGALGDGVADESTYVQSAITNATGTVDLLGLTYRCDSQLTVPSNRRIINGVLDFSSCSATDGFIKIAGSIGSAASMSAVLANSTDLTSTLTPGVVAGDLIKLVSSDAVGSGIGRAEFQRVRDISASTVVLCGFTGDLAFISSPTYALVTAKTRVTLQDIEIRGALSGTRYGVYLSYCDDVQLDNVRFSRINTSAVYMANSVNISIRGAAVLSSGAVAVIEGCEHVYLNGVMDDGGSTTSVERIRIGLASAGVGQGLDVISSDIRISGCSIVAEGLGSGTGIAAYVYSRRVMIDDCTIRRGGTGVYLESLLDAQVSRCVIDADSGQYGVRGLFITSTTHANWSILDNHIGGSAASSHYGYGVLLESAGAAATATGVRIHRNLFAADTYGVLITMATGASTSIKGIDISNNSFTMGAMAQSCVRILTSAAATTSAMEDVRICSNTFVDVTTNLVAVQVTRQHATPTLKGVLIAHNTFSSSQSPTAFVSVSSADFCTIVGNILRGTAVTGISFSHGLAATVRGLIISANNIFDAGLGILINPNLNATSIIQGVVTNGNLMYSVTRGIYFNAASSSKITEISSGDNVSFLDSDVAPAQEFDCSNAGDITNVAAAGNVSDNGTYGLDFSSSCTVVDCGVNTGRSMATGGVNGADTIDGTNNPV